MFIYSPQMPSSPTKKFVTFDAFLLKDAFASKVATLLVL